MKIDNRNQIYKNNPEENIVFFPLLEEMLQQGKTVKIALSGLSMFPFLMHGDIVQVVSVKNKKPKKGDIVVFELNGKWIAHRLIKHNLKKNLYYTRGDSRTTKDSPQPPENIKGIVVNILQSRWQVARFATGKLGRVIAFCSVVTAPFFHFVIWIKSLGKNKGL